ncbi:MAG: iron ABC transporter substrate-binding protein [Ilumatobacter sp.]|nr:MAG: iron ABC transporter substrate-binding protein [Ilumatobacter sp.]
MTRTPRLLAALAAGALLLAACGGDDDAADTTDAPATTEPDAMGPITLYSGRGEDLVQPVIDAFVADTGIEVEVRYGNSSEMLLLIQEEGANSPADVYYSQGAGFLGILSADGGLVELPGDVLDRVIDDGLRSPVGDWVGLTGRARTVVYNTDLLTEADIPDSLLDFTDPAWSGRIGYAPTNASFQDHVTALRFLLGEDATREWLEGIIANDPIVYENNGAILEGVANAEVEVGLTNHYYLYRLLIEDPDFPVANKFYSDGDPGALVNIAGAGVLATSDDQDAAIELIRYLLSVEAQQMFSSSNFELPVIADVDVDPQLPTIDSLVLPAFDLNQLLDLEGTVDLLIEVGAL